MSSDAKQPPHTSSITYFWLNSLESLLNAFVDLDPTTRHQLIHLDGIVVRVKTFAPYQVFYLLFTSDGIEVSPKPQGEVQVRLSGRVRDLVWTLLGLESEQYAESRGHLHLWGETPTLDNLRQLLQEFNLRAAASQWLKSHWPLKTLWQKLSEQDLSWLQDLQPLPTLIKQTRQEIAALKVELSQQQQQLTRVEQQLAQQLKLSKLLLIGMALMITGGIAGTVVKLLS
ncbi:SCP2 sterol-binding domain-containing protein [Agitococcus lubricus]|uniref:SCP-2 sterol transfer family protein n=1 Tax=Agitococcus lubricus TaxID=1077255 RepID=A0A2T5J1I3_9GAMM|nr:SCP2 sterol-binding domain-containing protein [Agitococcus lubricus]PTQ90305.1 SCP-2 sterol transfer family protein [Agitococcus lubricus]